MLVNCRLQEGEIVKNYFVRPELPEFFTYGHDEEMMN